MSAVLAVKDLCTAYGGRPVIEGISFELCPGSMLGILGPNGSGKTTLLRCLAGSLAPISGKISHEGRPGRIEQHVAAVTSEPPLAREFTAMEFALLGRFPWLGWTGMYSARDRKCARAALQAVSLDSLRDRKLNTFSSGQLRLAALGRGFSQIWLTESPLFLLDEPAANLDLRAGIGIFRLLEDYLAQGWAVAAAMHDCNLAALFCTHLLGIREGRQVFFGQTEEVFTEENLGELYNWPVGIYRHPDMDRPQLYMRLQPPVSAADSSQPDPGCADM